MATGGPLHRSTMRLKYENLKTSVLKRPLESTASEFLLVILSGFNGMSFLFEINLSIFYLNSFTTYWQDLLLGISVWEVLFYCKVIKVRDHCKEPCTINLSQPRIKKDHDQPKSIKRIDYF